MVEVLPGCFPCDDVSNYSLSEHAPTSIMQVGKFMRNLCVHWQQLCLAGSYFIMVCFRLLIEFEEDGIKTMHGSFLVLVAEFYFAYPRWLKDTTATLLICIHLHACFVDGWVNDNPSTTTKLSTGWYIHEDWMTIYS
mmetsp:Transcript_7159/g.32735  ORF Transcript_7159/g.32735 Transcript_7159/m.32735 type:complete len:137 (+) Transcript_7159:3428-3838(+)